MKAKSAPTPSSRPPSTGNAATPPNRRTPARTSCTRPCTRSSARKPLQRGSFNKAGYLRFDFAWGEGLSTATRSEIEEVSNIAIRNNFRVDTKVMGLAEAKALGAMALFGENYGNEVRVVEIDGAWSRELCGGTHVANTSLIGSLSLLGEQSVGSGNRRVEAFVGMDAFRHLAAERALVTELTEMLKVPSGLLADRIATTLTKLKTAEKELERLRKEQLTAAAAAARGHRPGRRRRQGHCARRRPGRWRRRPPRPGPGPAEPPRLRGGRRGRRRCQQRPSGDPDRHQRGRPRPPA